MHAQPRILQVVNVTGLLLGEVLLLTGVNKSADLVVLVPVPILLSIYWRLRARPTVVAVYFGIAMALFTWVALCENIVLVDRIFGTRQSAQLRVGPRLTTYIQTRLPSVDRRETEPCCNDPLTWHYRPGSSHRAVFDCPTCYPPFEATVD